MNRTLDEHIAQAKVSVMPLRENKDKNVIPFFREKPQSNEPSDLEAKILCAIPMHASSLVVAEKFGDLTAFASRLRYELLKIEEALRLA